jgi:hypothetical protein
MSLENIAKRFRWSRGKAERFISELETANQIVRQKNNVTTLFSIVNYDEYQSNDKADNKPNGKPSSKADGQQTVKQTDTNNNANNENNEENDKEDLKLLPETSSALPESVNADTPGIKKMAPTSSGVNAKPKKEKPPTPENVRLLRADIRNFFLEYYEKKINMKYYWQPKDAVALIEVVKKIEFQYPSGHIATDEEILNSFKHCISAINDRWILANLSMTIINSKANEIFNQIKNPNHGKLDHKQRAELAFIELKAKGLY